ncbi:MAG: hypothetical protein KVP17_001576 [Porospora cf. gigantea B]|nr:MAG: hypothetical protein KVP17_001576 [Porospora cf. gigantea B]
MKAFIQTNQQMSLALSDSISVVSGDGVTTANHFGNSATPDIVLEDTSFHAGVNLAHWGAQRVLTFCPPQGEFSLLQYRMSQLQCPPPFILLPAISAQRSDRLELTVTLRSTLPDSTYGINIVLGTTLPADTGLASTGPLVEGQAVDFDRSSRELLWKVGRLRGGHSCMLHAKLDVAKPSMAEQAQRLMGPFSLTFEVPMFTLSGIAVKHLRWAHQPQTASAQRWVRYVTQSGSYMCRAS